jgi:cytidylate kinase
MSIVAVSDTVGSLGVDIGRMVAAALGYEFADREIIAKAAERFGGGLMELTHAAEEKPTLLDRFSEAQRRYLAYLEAILLELAARDNVVLVGRATTVVFRDVPHTLRVRVNAPEGVRAQRVEQQQGLTQEAALDYVRQTDRERGARVRFFYHVDWNDPLLYDLVLNTERLSVDEGVRLVLALLRTEKGRFQTTTLSHSTVADRSLTAQARAALLANPATRAQQIFVSCARGAISLTGSVRSDEQRKMAHETVAKIPGVADVLNDIIVISTRIQPGV